MRLKVKKKVQPQFFVHFSGSSTPFVELEPAKEFARCCPGASYILSLAGQIMWERNKSGSETDYDREQGTYSLSYHPSKL